MRFPSDGLIIDKFKNHLESDENELYYIIGQLEISSWALSFPIIGKIAHMLTTKFAFIGLTNRRVLIMRVSWDFDERDFESIEFSEIKHFEVEDPIMTKIIPIPAVERTLYLNLNTGKEYKIKAPTRSDRIKKQEENVEKICNKLKGISDDNDSRLEADNRKISVPKEIRKPEWPQLEEETEIPLFPLDLSKDIEKPEETARHYAEAIEIDPKNAMAHYSYASLLENMEKFEEAAEHYVEAMEIDSEFAEFYKQMHVKTGNFPNALVLAAGVVVFVLLFYFIKQGILELIFGD